LPCSAAGSRTIASTTNLAALKLTDRTDRHSGRGGDTGNRLPFPVDAGRELDADAQRPRLCLGLVLEPPLDRLAQSRKCAIGVGAIGHYADRRSVLDAELQQRNETHAVRHAIVQAQADGRLEALGEVRERRGRPGVQAMRILDDDIEAVRQVLRLGGGRGARMPPTGAEPSHF
jgi:hypothetical protein